MLNPAVPSRETHIHIAGHRPRAVLDPWLCLQPSGPVLIQRLQPYVELWVVRELWNILDNSQYYQARPEALLSGPATTSTFDQLSPSELRRLLQHSTRTAELGSADGRTSDGSGQMVSYESLATSIHIWERIRASSDLAGLQLFWAGDSLAESLFPAGTAGRTQAAYESAARILDRALRPRTPIACGQRDAVALAIALGGIPILGVASRDATAARCPLHYEQLCASERLRISAAPEDALAATERALWWNMLCGANANPLIWNGLHLGLLHVHAPWLVDAFCYDDPDEPSDVAVDIDEERMGALDEVWERTVAYWQVL
jgi:hypothetical protein